jgi:hypothetical protein
MTMPSVEIFVDESRHRNYVLAAAVVATGDLKQSKKSMRTIKPANRDRVHMHAEGRASQDKILAEFIRLRPIAKAFVFTGSVDRGRSERDVRNALLQELAWKAVDLGATRILIESCDQDKEDLNAVVGALVKAGARDRVRVDVDTPHSNEMLWAADIVAWAVGHGNRKLEAAEMIEVFPL